MNIAALCASPKGQPSVTVQYVRYLQQRYPQHAFHVEHVGSRIHELESKPEALDAILDVVAASDAVLWCFPVYVCLVPSQMKRFLELIEERGRNGVFSGKHASALTTSVHYYDHTAHHYIHALSEDWGMTAIPGHSCSMDALLKDDKRRQLDLFFQEFILAVEQKWPMPRMSLARHEPPAAFSLPKPEPMPMASGHHLLLLWDSMEHNRNLAQMVDYFRDRQPHPVDVLDLRELRIQSGCTSCYHCSSGNVCLIRDDLTDKVAALLARADMLVFAGAIHDRFLSARWKAFWDRGFHKGHVPWFQGKPVGWMLSGSLRRHSNLRQILEAETVSCGSPLAGIVTDEDPPGEVVRNLDVLGQRLRHAAKTGRSPFTSYMTEGGRYLFRDMVYRSRAFFVADHRYYKKHGYYDFPQKNWKERATNRFMLTLSLLPGFRKEFVRQARTEMLKPYEKVIANAKGSVRTYEQNVFGER
jgi:multimeric flavodoxin WrbA